MKQLGQRTGERSLLSYLNKFFLITFILVGVGCSSKPLHELILADVALKASQKAKADSLSPDLYRKAENHLLRAKRDYREGYYESCRKFADKARILAERAEYRAVKKTSRLRGGGQF